MHDFHVSAAGASPGLDIIGGTDYTQVSFSVLEPGEHLGDRYSRHPYSDHWVLVLEGSGVAKIDGSMIPLAEGSLVLIERGEFYELSNTSDAPLRMLNFYGPPAY